MKHKNSNILSSLIDVNKLTRIPPPQPKLNGQLQYAPNSAVSPNNISNTVNNTISNNTHVSAAGPGGITEQQLKAVLSNLVNSRVVQVGILFIMGLLSFLFIAILMNNKFSY